MAYLFFFITNEKKWGLERINNILKSTKQIGSEARTRICHGICSLSLLRHEASKQTYQTVYLSALSLCLKAFGPSFILIKVYNVKVCFANYKPFLSMFWVALSGSQNLGIIFLTWANRTPKILTPMRHGLDREGKRAMRAMFPNGRNLNPICSQVHVNMCWMKTAWAASFPTLPCNESKANCRDMANFTFFFK
jgi:hypothetical protein